MIQNLNAEMVANGVSNPKSVIVGPSMGGQITRYALRWMEMQQALGTPDMQHNCRLWISFDSPHHGANIPFGLQESLRYLGDIKESGSATKFLKEQLRTPAAREMLISQIKDNKDQSFSVLQDYMNGQNPRHIAYYNAIASMGMPQQCRKVALVNGSYKGGEFQPNGGKMYDFDIWKNTSKQWHLLNNNVFFAANSTSPIVLFKKFNTISIFLPFAPYLILEYGFYGSINYPNGYKALDGAPGGIHDVQKEFYDKVDMKPIVVSDKGLVKNGYAEVSNKSHYSTFIPTYSSLAIVNKNTDWKTPISISTLVCDQQTPFENVYAPAENQGHTELNAANVNWIMQEIDFGQLNCPTICASQLNGIGNRLCQNQQTTVTLNNSLPANTGILWELSTGLTAQSPTVGNTYLNVKSTGSNNSAWVRATLTPKNNNGEQCGASAVVNYTFASGNGGSVTIAAASPADQCNYIAKFNTHIQGNTYQWSKDNTNYYSSGSEPNSFIAIDIVKPYDNGKLIYCKVTNTCGSVYINKQFIPLSSSGLPPCPVSAKLEMKDDKGFKADVYPNPTSDYWTVQIPIYLDNTFTFTLYDINGRVVYLKENVSLENSNFYLDGSKLSKGVYLLKIKDKNKQEHQYKLVKN